MKLWVLSSLTFKEHRFYFRSIYSQWKVFLGILLIFLSVGGLVLLVSTWCSRWCSYWCPLSSKNVGSFTFGQKKFWQKKTNMGLMYREPNQVLKKNHLYRNYHNWGYSVFGGLTFHIVKLQGNHKTLFLKWQWFSFFEVAVELALAWV